MGEGGIGVLDIQEEGERESGRWSISPLKLTKCHPFITIATKTTATWHMNIYSHHENMHDVLIKTFQGLLHTFLCSWDHA